MNRQIYQDQISIRGGMGGGSEGGGARTPVEAPDSLRSKQYGRILDLLSEGEIFGLINGLQSFFLNGTPVQNPDGSINFPGITLDTRSGTQSQTPLAGFTFAESEVPVGLEVKTNLPIVRHISNPDINTVRFTIGTPQLGQQVVDTGDIVGASAEFAIDVQSNGAGFQEVRRDSFQGKASSLYQRQYAIPLTGSAPWDVRVRRISQDEVTQRISNKTFWYSYTEIVESKYSYPNSALAGSQIDSEQFSSLPNRGYEIKGIICKIPANYDPETRTYLGVWDGTFKLGWTNCPAWCFYDLCTSRRYGMGRYIDVDQIDKWALYQIGQYCDEIVPNGFGGFEPRFTCSLYLQASGEAFRVLANFASMFRAMTYWYAGSVLTVADMPQDVIPQPFTNANIIGKFNYQGTARSTRHTVAYVTWNNPDLQYGQDVEYVEFEDAIKRFGIIPTSIVAFGCTSRGQAHRYGEWLLYSEQMETETVTFRTGLEGTIAYPGAVIQTIDSKRAGKRQGGRLLAITSPSEYVIDDSFEFESGVTYSFTVIGSDGTVMTRAIINAPGTTDLVQLESDLPILPALQSIWLIVASNIYPEEWRILSVAETNPLEIEIVALEYNSSKYNFIEKDLKLEEKPHTSITSKPPVIKNLRGQEIQFEAGYGVVVNRFILSWTGVTGRFYVSYKHELGNWVYLPQTNVSTINIDGLEKGLYTFAVYQKNVAGIPSDPVQMEMTLLGGDILNAPPMPDVSGLELYGQGNNTAFTVASPKFVWRASSVSQSFDIGSESHGAGSGALDFSFKDYLVRIFDPLGTQVHESSTLSPEFTYEIGRNLLDNGGSPRRTFTIKVWQRGIYNQISRNPAILTVSNPQPGLPTGFSVVPGFREVTFRFTPPTDPDWDGVIIWMSALSGFTPSSNVVGSGNCVFRGKDHVVHVPALTGATYYIRYASYDLFGLTGITVSGELSTTTIKILSGDVLEGQILQSHLFETLSERIDLIDGPDTVTGSVNQRLTDLEANLSSEISTVTSVVKGGFDTVLIWQFDTTVESWVTDGTVTLSWSNASLHVDETGTTGRFKVALASNISGSQYYKIQARIKRLAGAGWLGRAQYSTTTRAGFSTSFMKDIPDPTLAVGESQVVEWRMDQLTAGGTEWTTSLISSIALQLGSTAADEWEVDWVGIGREAPPASYAVVQTQAQSIGGLSAQYTVKIDNNGFVSGYGLASTLVNAVPLSEFYVRADRFAIGGVGVAQRIPFIVDTLAGVVYMDTAVIKFASIQGAHIGDLQVDTIKIGSGAISSVAATTSGSTGTTGTVITYAFTTSGYGTIAVKGLFSWFLNYSIAHPTATITATIKVDGAPFGVSSVTARAHTIPGGESGPIGVNQTGSLLAAGLCVVGAGSHSFTLHLTSSDSFADVGWAAGAYLELTELKR